MPGAIENNTTDALLFELIKGGDEDAFRAIFDKYYVPLCRYSVFYVKEMPAAEEVVLDVFVNLWQNRQVTEISNSMRLYLFRSVRNRSLNHLRRIKQNHHIDEVLHILWEYPENEWLEAEELDYFIQEAILSLPEKCREVFIMSRADDKSNREIAEKLGISVKTVEGQITKAIKRIREHLNDIYLILF